MTEAGAPRNPRRRHRSRQRPDCLARPAKATAPSTGRERRLALRWRRRGPFGGGPIAEAARGVRRLGQPPGAGGVPSSSAGRWLVEQPSAGHAGAGDRRLGPARDGRPRAVGGGAFGVRAITNAAALELREHGIHVALLIVDAGIEPHRRAVVRASPRRAGRPLRDRKGGCLPRRSGRARRRPTSCRSPRSPSAGCPRPIREPPRGCEVHAIPRGEDRLGTPN